MLFVRLSNLSGDVTLLRRLQGLFGSIERAGAEELNDVMKAAMEDKETGNYDYELIIIGGGSAAFSAALRASELGGRILIVNDGLPIGGTCVNVGCIPSKTLIRAGEVSYHASHTHFEGIEVHSTVTDFKRVIQQQKELVADMRQSKYVDVIRNDPNIEWIKGRGHFAGEHEVKVGGKNYSGRFLMIATGARPFIPAVPGLKEAGYLTNETAYELEELPEHLIILGGRYVALENAQLFRRLGSQVTILQRSERILPTESPDITEALRDYLEGEGVRILTAVDLEKVYPIGNEVIVQIRHAERTERIRGSHILAATGRHGNTDGLGLKEIGVHVFGQGYVAVDETLRTTQPHIFAVGDVNGEAQFVYTAAYEGRLAAENALTDSHKLRDFSVVPWVIFTDPQVAGVGMDERQAENAGIDYDTATVELSRVPRAQAARDTRGFVKLIRDVATDHLVGARILAPEGSELLMEVALAIRHGITIQKLTNEFHPYLTLSEAIKLAALAFNKDVSKLSSSLV